MVDRRLRYVRKRQIARRRADLRQTRLQQAQPRSGAVAQVNTVEPPFIHRAANEAALLKADIAKGAVAKIHLLEQAIAKDRPLEGRPFAHSYASSTSSTRTLETYPSPSEKTASNSSSPMRASCAAERANPTGAFAPAWLRPACRSPLVIRSSHAILFTARPPCAVPPGTLLALSLSTFRSAWRQTQRRHHHQLTRRVQHQSMASERATWASATHTTAAPASAALTASAPHPHAGTFSTPPAPALIAQRGTGHAPRITSMMRAQRTVASNGITRGSRRRRRVSARARARLRRKSHPPQAAGRGPPQHHRAAAQGTTAGETSG